MEQKTIILVIITISLAMVGATTVTSYNTKQQAFAVKCESFTLPGDCFCYTSGGGSIKNCFENKGDCQKAQRSNSGATSGCFKQK